MVDVCIGVDQGSTKGHGVAVYRDGTLEELHMMSHEQLRAFIVEEHPKCDNMVFSIENVIKNKSTWRAKGAENQPAAAAMGRSIGMLRQSCVVLIEMLESYGISYVLQKPSSTWKKKGIQSKQFQLVTGWKGRSNEDTRSGAYFGYLVAGR